METVLDTALDTAHWHMLADQNDDAARLAFYGALADTELFILLEEESNGDNISPEILDLEDSKYTMAFDREERLAEFTKSAAPYAALPGRVLAGMLAGKEIGIGLNLGVAPSSILIPALAMEWLTKTLAETPVVTEGKGGDVFVALGPDSDRLLAALQERLRFAGGHIEAAFLAKTGGAAQDQALFLGFINVDETHHEAIARAVQEALTFTSGTHQVLDVVFLDANTAKAADLAKIGTNLNLPEPEPEPEAMRVTAPGSDPNKPPNLR